MDNNIDRLVRPNILSLSPYSTARDEYSGGSLGVFLDANESPYCNGINRYPDPRQKELKERISVIKGTKVENIFLGNGSDEAIDLCFRVFCRPGIDNAISMWPSYGMYTVAAATNDIGMRKVLLEKDFSLDTEKILSAADGNSKLLFLCSPNNPTANALPKSQIREICSRFGGIVVLDEAYVDFSSEGSMMEELSSFPNLIILQTFSKAWGMAGTRTGLAFSSERIISLFDMVKYPYNLSVLTQNTVLQWLDPSLKERHVREILSERERLRSCLSSLPCIKEIYPSQANFLLVRTDDSNAMYDFLISKGIIVRNRTTQPLCEGCLRITVGTPLQNDELLSALSSYGDVSSQIKVTASAPTPEDNRKFSLRRKTSETDIEIRVDLDGGAGGKVSTGLGFFDHMLSQIGRHGGFTLDITAKGDLEIDEHHTIEDVGIALGDAIRQALGSKAGIGRYGFCLPMDECDAAVLLDLGGRIDFRWEVEFKREYVGDVPTDMMEHFFKSLCCELRCNLHIKATGENDHHKAEGVFKAFARALRMAITRTPSPFEMPSSKGVI